MTADDEKIISNLSEPARKIFNSFDKKTKERILYKAKELEKKDRILKLSKKRSIKNKRIKDKNNKNEKNKKRYSKENKINKKIENLVKEEYISKKNKGVITKSMNTTILTSHILEIMLNTQGKDIYVDAEESVLEDSVKNDIFAFKKYIPSYATVNGKGFLKKRAKKKALEKSYKKYNKEVKTYTRKQIGKSTRNEIKEYFKKKISTRLPIIFAGLSLASVILLLIMFIPALISGITSSLGDDAVEGSEYEDEYECEVSEEVEKYRGRVEYYCEKNSMTDYVDLVMAIIMQESGGQGTDIMQSSACGYSKHNPVLSTDESIEAGVKYFSHLLSLSKVEDPSDIENLYLAVQAYNYGEGYISYAIEKDGGYTKENASSFSIQKALELGIWYYGDSLYVEHVFRYYHKVGPTVITDNTITEILEELEENNEASDDVWKVIYKGASLIGKITYSMEKRQGDGRNNPTYLDCSSFVAWTFHKSGYSSIPYYSTTATFLTSTYFTDVKKLKVGDIGLMNSSTAAGGTNHIGIYCGKLKDGRSVWLHCTNSSVNSLTGNDSGVMFGNETYFTIYRRLNNWMNTEK